MTGTAPRLKHSLGSGKNVHVHVMVHAYYMHSHTYMLLVLIFAIPKKMVAVYMQCTYVTAFLSSRSWHMISCAMEIDLHIILYTYTCSCTMQHVKLATFQWTGLDVL